MSTSTVHPATSPDPATATDTETASVIHPGTIVVGVDGSPESDLAVVWAAEQARAEGRVLSLVHATRPAQAWAQAYGYYDAALVGAEDAAGPTVLSRTLARVTADFADVEVHAHRRAVDPRQLLLDLAEKAHLLVVGSRGHGTVARLVLGSVSAAVARHAACPVVVVRAGDPEAATRGILVGIDRDGSPAAVAFAFRQASVRGLPLTVSHCCYDSFDAAATGGAVYLSGLELAHDTPGYETGRLVVDEAVAGLREQYPDVVLTLRLAPLPVDSYLVAAAGSCDMVVVGAHAGLAPLAFLVGRDTEHALVTRAPAVVAVVPEPAAQR